MEVKTFQAAYSMNAAETLTLTVQQQLNVWLRENPDKRITLMTQCASGSNNYGPAFVLTTILYEDKG